MTATRRPPPIDEHAQRTPPHVRARALHPSLQELHDFADKIGWRCLSQESRSAAAAYEFECRNGHRFERLGGKPFAEKARCAQCEAVEVK